VVVIGREGGRRRRRRRRGEGEGEEGKTGGREEEGGMRRSL
jgi:hypothetical protein